MHASMWRSVEAYCALFRPWLAGDSSAEAAPVDKPALDALLKVSQRYGTRSALAWMLSLRAVTPDVQRYAELTLLYARTKAKARHGHILALAEAMNGIGIAPLLLKGSAMQVTGIYPDPGFRLMADIDLLVPAQAYAACEQAAAAIGFAVRSQAGRGHANQQYHAGDQALLELHRFLTRWHGRDNFPPERLLGSAREITMDGARMLVPDWSLHAVLVILHAFAWDEMRLKALLPLKALFDLACLKASNVVDWQRTAAILQEIEETPCLLHAEVLFEHLFGMALTGHPITAARRRRVIAWYALGANHRMLTRLALALLAIRRRIGIGISDPAALKKVFTLGFYRRLAKSIFQSFEADNPRT